MQLVQGTVVSNRFRLEHPLGQGGMGSVWLAQHLNLEIPCALKFLHPEAASSAVIRARFEREAKAAAQLRSANVVQILDHGVWEDVPFIAMELLEGEDLDHRLRRLGRLDPRTTAGIVAQVARALTRAHAAGLVHRDLKPANIFLARDDDREVAKVLDFGVAKQTGLDVGDAKTKTGAILGTPYYMSPEQGRGLREVDHRSDLWAVAVITYRCLVGRLPFQSEALGDLLMKIINEPLPVPSQIQPVPPGFDAWWARAAARDPNERFQSARELSDALALALGLSSTGAAVESRAVFQDDSPMPIPPRDRTVVLGDAPQMGGTSPLPTTGAISTSAVSAPLPAAPSPRGGRGMIIGGAAVIAVIAAGAIALVIALRRPAGDSTPGVAGSQATSSAAAPSAPASDTANAPNPPSTAPASSASPSAAAPTSSAAPSATTAPRGPHAPTKPAPSPKSPTAPNWGI